MAGRSCLLDGKLSGRDQQERSTTNDRLWGIPDARNETGLFPQIPRLLYAQKGRVSCHQTSVGGTFTSLKSSFRKFQRSSEVLHNNHEPETISEEFASTSDVLLDCFPSVNSGQLHMPQLHRSTALVPTECSIKAHPSVLSFSKGVRHRKPCRPPYWPSLLPAVASSTWSEYSQRKKTLIDQIYTNCKRKRYALFLSDCNIFLGQKLLLYSLSISKYTTRYSTATTTGSLYRCSELFVSGTFLFLSR